jgi:uncharacterized membrane protein YkvA (DUF1232 family)
MSDEQRRSLGFWAGIIRQFRLAWRLLWDPRVSGGAKLVPILALLYIFSPIDFVPDWFLGFGQLDDLGVLLAGVRLFTGLVPDEIVLQHLEAMGFPVSRWRVIDPEAGEPPAIDAEYEAHEVQDE